MSYEYIEDVLLDDNLSMVEIEALKPISDSYTMAILQLEENLYADDFVVRNDNQASATAKYNSFFEKVYADNIQLVLSAEYSCPWNSLSSALNGNFPKEGSLWVIGCESITFDELDRLKASHPDIFFYYEEIQKTIGRNFLDPVVYCFNTINNEGEIKKVVLVQFKQLHMVDHGTELERDHMIKGTKRYILRNNIQSTYLTALICAEAMVFDHNNDIPQYEYFLIPHIQLVANPYHELYMHYRIKTFIDKDSFEYICVNWAQGFRINGSTSSRYGGSSIYTASEEIKKGDTRLNKNHDYGIYYAYAYGHHYNIYNLNYSEHLFYLKNNQILQTSSPRIDRRRQGIEAYETYIWDNNWIECNYPCDDRWKSHLETEGFFESIQFLLPYKALTKERFLSITSGHTLNTTQWQNFENLESFKVNTEEVSNSLSEFCDPRNNQNLTEIVSRIDWLQRNILLNGVMTYPMKFSDIQDVNNFIINEDLSKCHSNISLENGNSLATFVGLGCVTEQKAQQVFDNIAIALGGARRRLIVWYEDLHDHSTKSKYDENEPQINEDLMESPVSIAREG